MKKVLVVIAVLVIAMAGSAFAASQSNTVPVQATVGATACKAINPGSLSITIPDDSVLVAVTSGGAGDSDTTIQCQLGQATTSITAQSANAGAGSLTSSGTLNGLLVNGAYSLSYTMTFAGSITGAGYGGSGKDKILIAKNALSATPTGGEGAGVYNDTVTITVNY